MKLDFHCHTSEGSPDSMVSLLDTIKLLHSNGFNGAVITDHNSYKGYDKFKNTDINYNDFVLIRGIEYDTRDAGHMLIILPNKYNVDIFTVKGMYLIDVLKIVKKLGGIIGPAHPFDYYKFGMFNHIKWLSNIDILSEFDFIEGFNSCSTLEGNYLAQNLGSLYNKPLVGGSDSHRLMSVGKASTTLSVDIIDNDSLIEEMKYKKNIIGLNGEQFIGAAMLNHGKLYDFGLKSYWFYNSLISKTKVKKLELIFDILGV